MYGYLYMLMQGCPNLVHEGHRPAGFSTISALIMADYLKQVYLVNQKMERLIHSITND